MPKIKENKKGKIESESITFRIEKSVLDELWSEADQKMESVNTLVNQIIKSYVQWHKPARNAGLGYFSKVLLAKSMDHLTDEQVINMTEEFCSQHLRDITHMLRSSHTFSSFMEGLCFWLDSSGYRLGSIALMVRIHMWYNLIWEGNFHCILRHRCNRYLSILMCKMHKQKWQTIQ